MNINDFLTCKFANCNKYFETPVKLTCEHTICKEHLNDKNYLLENNKFKCPFCYQIHDLNENSVKINYDILNVLKMNLHLNSKQLMLKESNEELKQTIGQMYNLINEPNKFISEQINKIRDDIMTKRDELKNSLDELSNNILIDLNNYEQEFLNKSSNSEFLVEDIKKDVESSMLKYSESNALSRIPQINESKLDYYIRLLEKQIQVNNDKISDFKKHLTNNKVIQFEKSNLKLDDNILGSLKIDDLSMNDVYRVCLTTINNAHSHIIDCMQIITPNHLVTCSRDKRIKFWNLNDKICVKTLEGEHKDEIKCLRLFPNSKRMASGSADMTIKIWDLQTFECVKTLLGHEDCVNCLELMNNNDENILLSGSRDKSIRIWDLKNSSSKSLIGHTDEICCMLSFLDSYLITGSADSTIKVWSLNFNQCFKTLQGHEDKVSCLETYLNDFLLSGSLDKTIRLWSIETGECLTKVLSDSRIRCLKLMSSNDLILSGNNVNLKLWKLNKSNKSILFVKFIEGHMDTVFDLRLMPNNNLISCSGDGCIKIWKF